MNLEDYKKIIEEVLYSLDVGIHVVDHLGKTIIYNDAMARLEKMEVNEVLERPFSEAFINIREDDSTLLQVLKYKSVIVKNRQIYYNKYGKKIVTDNSTAPIIDDGRLLGAVEIAKDVTHIERMTNTILELQHEASADEITRAPIPRIKKYTFADLIGQAPTFIKAIELAKKAAMTSSSVLISGETGTGKELIAQSIHYESVRKNKPFLAQNCAALPESLLEGLFFGTEKGGFTDAVSRAGLFEQADGGTLLLDEVNAMPYGLQGKLLRVLQEEYIRRIGALNDIPVDVRIIATINEPAHELMSSGKLRKDLYYRLNVMHVDVPPLRERMADIGMLSHYFLLKHSKKQDKNIHSISDRALEKLKMHDYPGNVRELENIIMRAVSLSENVTSLKVDSMVLPNYRPFKYSHPFKGNLDSYLSEIEEGIVRSELKANWGNVSKTAQALGMKRQTLQHKLKKYSINTKLYSKDD